MPASACRGCAGNRSRWCPGSESLRRLGRSHKSRAAYDKAIELVGNTAEIAYLHDAATSWGSALRNPVQSGGWPRWNTRRGPEAGEASRFGARCTAAIRIRNAHNAGTPRLLANCGGSVEVLDKQQIEDPALTRVTRARTTSHTDSLPAMAPHSSRHVSKRVGCDASQHGSRNERPLARRLVGQLPRTRRSCDGRARGLHGQRMHRAVRGGQPARSAPRGHRPVRYPAAAR